VSAQAVDPNHPSGSSFHDQIPQHEVILPPQPLSQLVDLDCVTIAIISSIKGQIKEANLLLADGSNYTVWSDFIDKRMRDALNHPYYLHGCSINKLHTPFSSRLLTTPYVVPWDAWTPSMIRGMTSDTGSTLLAVLPSLISSVVSSH
jgi:hypothetical protein